MDFYCSYDFLIHRRRLCWALPLDTVGILGYLWLVERCVRPGAWYLRLAVPIVLLLFVLIAGDAFLIRRVVTGRLRQTAAAVITDAAAVGGNRSGPGFLSGWKVVLFWSLLVSLPCLLLALLLLVLDRRKRFKAQMPKRLHL